MDCDGLIGASGQAGGLTLLSPIECLRGVTLHIATVVAVVAVADGVATVPAHQLTTDRIAALMGDAAYDQGWLRPIERRAIETSGR